MLWSTLLQTVSIGLVAPSLCHASPFQVDSAIDQPQRQRLHRRQATNCSSIREPSNECFSSVDLGSYVQGWLQNNTCQAGEGFSTCYFRQNGLSGSDCSKTSDNTCRSSSAPDGSSVQVAYTIANIRGKSRSAGPRGREHHGLSHNHEKVSTHFSTLGPTPLHSPLSTSIPSSRP